MIVAMIAMTVMQPAIDEKIGVVAVRHHLVSAIYVLTVATDGNANRRIFIADRDYAFVIVPCVRRMQMSIVQIIQVIAVLHCQMTAVRAMSMCVFSVSCMRHL